MAIKVGINGFGRIGRVVLRIMIEHPEQFDICGINLRKADLDYMVYMIKYDSVFRQFNGTVEHKDKNLIVNGHTIQVFSESDAAMIPWSSCGAEYIIESTGAYNTTEKASRHFKGGAKKVILTAPGKDEVTPTFVMGVNHMLLHSDMKVVSNASCTTNCLAPLAKVVNDEFGIEQALMSTIHAATAKQKAVDSRGGSDWRTGRSILNNIIPSSTGAAKAVGRVIPELYGKMTGMSFRVPTADVSVVDLTAHLKVKTTYADICYAIRHASETYMKGIIGYTADQVVSTDLIGNSCPCIFDETAGIMLDNDFVKLIAWYDNEWGYSNMVVRLLEHMVAVDEGRVTPEKRVVPKDKPKEEPAAKCSTWLGTRRSRAARSSWAAVRRAGEKMPVPPSSSSRWSQVRVTVTEWACSSRRESTSICWGVKSVKPSSHRSLPAAQGQSFSFIDFVCPHFQAIQFNVVKLGLVFSYGFIAISLDICQHIFYHLCKLLGIQMWSGRYLFPVRCGRIVIILAVDGFLSIHPFFRLDVL